jgi:type I restriction enzyme, S subunit
VIEALRPYVDLVATQTGWLPHVPVDWQVLRAKHIFREVDRRSVDGAETHLSMHQKLGLVPSVSTGEKRLVSESYAGGKVVEPNDLVLNRLKAHLGVFAHANQQGVISPDYTVLRPLPNADVRYYEYLLKSPACRGELRTRIKGIVEGFWRLYTDDFYDIRLPVPPLDEQRLIVRFLDWHGAMTAKQIRAKRRLIALLNEQKQSIIHRAVTRGLDPAAKLKPSCVDWLGDVPEHWEVKRLRDTARKIIGGVWGNDPQGNDDVLCIRVADFDRHGLQVFPRSPTLRSFKPSELNGRILERGDLLIEKSGGGDTQSVGCVVIYDSDVRAVCSNFIVRATATKGCDSKFLLFVHSCLYRTGAVQRSIKQTTGIQNLDLSSYMNERLAIPPLDEQAAIVRHIAKATVDFDAAMNVARDEIALIQEFRTRLIADVVTGQLDVRALAAGLPDTTEADATAGLTDEDDLDEDADTLADEEEVA